MKPLWIQTFFFFLFFFFLIQQRLSPCEWPLRTCYSAKKTITGKTTMIITITANNCTLLIMCWAQFQTLNPQPYCLSIHKIRQFVLQQWWQSQKWELREGLFLVLYFFPCQGNTMTSFRHIANFDCECQFHI